MNKKGLSDVISSVLIILIVLVAASIIGAVVLRTTGQGSGQAESSISKIANATASGKLNVKIPQGLVAYYKFDNDLSDSSGSNNPGTAVGTISYAPGAISGGPYGTWNSVNFPGLSEYVQVPSSSTLNFGTGSFSVAMWGYYRNFMYPRSWFIISKATSCYITGSPGWEIGNGDPNVANGISLCYSDGTNLLSTFQLSFDPGYRPTDLTNKWAFVVVVFDKGTNQIRAYVNGAKQSSVISIPLSMGSASNSNNLIIGQANGWISDGMMDEVSIYNRPLTDSEVAALYASYINPFA